MPELVSFLIPAYNAEEWLADTISSALGQTWPNKELIIVDDGSADSTYRIAKAFESNRVKVLTQANSGVCGARNEALRLAQGSYIQWLDADDLLEADKISRQLKEAENGLSSKALLTSAFGTFFYRKHKANFQPTSLWQDLAPVEWIRRKFVDNVWMNPAAWLVSRRLMEEAGPWDERLSRSGDDDGEYVCRLASASREIKFVAEAKCYYRIGNIGSLNWRIGIAEGASDEQMEALYLSLRLSFGHLRSLEDSERTRLACLQYLHRWLEEFYPRKPGLIRTVEGIAQELGGELPPPAVNWKYYPLQEIFGWRTATIARSNWRKAKLMARKNWDRLLSRLS